MSASKSAEKNLKTKLAKKNSKTKVVEKTSNTQLQKLSTLEFPVYSSILDTTHILSSLVKNITNDELFQKHVSSLNESANPIDIKKAQIINETIFNMRVFGTKLNPLFLAKDIGILLGIPHIKYIVRKFDAEEMVIGYIKTTTNKVKKVIFLTRHGIYRCFYVSRSPLARLFRKFIGNLIDHMITHETEILQKISAAFKTENPELIEQGIMDLSNKVAELEVKYNEEKIKAETLTLQYEDEQKKRHELEQEKTEADIINSYNMMYIEQLKQDKNNYSNKIKNIRDELIPDDESVDTLEIKLIREKYMKPVYINILHPAYFSKLLNRQLDGPNTSHTTAKIAGKTATKLTDDDDDTFQFDEFDKKLCTGPANNKQTAKQVKNSKEEIQSMINEMPTYKKNYESVFSGNELDNHVKIENDEILYYCLNFSRSVAKKDKIIYVETKWVANKIHFNKLINSMTESCITLTFNKMTLFKTTLDEINDIIREELISL